MKRKLSRFIRGAGSVMEIWPAKDQQAGRTNLYLRPASNEEALRGYWKQVGSYLRQAMDAEREQQGHA